MRTLHGFILGVCLIVNFQTRYYNISNAVEYSAYAVLITVIIAWSIYVILKEIIEELNK